MAKRLLPLIAFLFICACAGYAQPVIDGSTGAQCPHGDTGLTTSTGGACSSFSTVKGSTLNCTASSLIIVGATSYANTGGIATDSKGNTYTALTSYHNSTAYTQLWYFIPTSSSQLASNMTFTLGTPGSAGFNSMVVECLHGTQGATAYRSATDAGNVAQTSMTVTPGASGDTIIALVTNDSTTASTINSGFTIDAQTNTTSSGPTGAVAHLGTVSSSAVTFAWTAAPSYTQAAAAFEVGPSLAAGSSAVMRRHD